MENKYSKKSIEHPETAHKQIHKLEKCKEKLEKSDKNTENNTDPEAHKNPNKEQIIQTEYNEQIVVNNKNGIIIATEVTQDANNQNQLLPMINNTQNNLQKALNITTEKSEQITHNMYILADNEYYKDEIIYKNYQEEQYNILIPNRKQASQQKDFLRRKSQRKENHNKKKDGFSKTQYDKRRRKPLLPMSRKQNTTRTTSLSKKIQ